MDPPASKCTFCAEQSKQSELIEMATNSLVLEDEMIEFKDLIYSVLFLKVQNESTACICNQCKNLLVQFYVFKENAKNNSLLHENPTISKVISFIDENIENDEQIYCTRYNKCLTLVPQSKRKFNEVFQQWQPQVIMEKIQQLSESLPPPPPKRQKIEEAIEDTCMTPFVPEVAEVEEPPAQKIQEEEEIVQGIEEVPNDPSVQVQDVQDVGDVEEVQEEGISENDWAQIEIDNSEMIKTDIGLVWLCKYCEPGPVTFHLLEDFRNHLLSTHLSYEQVGVEEMETESEEVIMEDYDIDDEAQTDLDEKTEVVASLMYECSQCDYTVGNRLDFKTHQKLHQSPRFERLFCVECSYQFATQAHFQAHLNGHQLYEIVAKHSQFPICEICNAMFCDESYENSHRMKHDSGESFEVENPLVGTFLKYGHHRSDLEIKAKEIPKGEEIVSCGHCWKRFHDEESCRLHQLIFHITTLKCPIENRVFKGNQAFSIHLRNNHPELFGDEAKFLCSVCKSEFETLYDKLKHMKTCDQKKFACNHCDKKFSQKCYLTNHLRLVSGQSSVVCEVCDKVCRDKGDYQIHSRSHSNIKPFQCSLCPKAYKTSSARAAHLETHNEDGFDCLYCPIKFKSRRTLQKHIKTKHPSKHFAEKISDAKLD